MIYLCPKGSVCYVLHSLTETCSLQGYTHDSGTSSGAHPDSRGMEGGVPLGIKRPEHEVHHLPPLHSPPPNAFKAFTITTANSWKLFSKTYKVIIT